MSTGQICCSNRKVIFDHAAGTAVCEGCGTVVEEGLIVSEISYSELSNGAAGIVGQMVSLDGNKNFRPGNIPNREGREVTLANGKRQIAQLAQALRLTQHQMETGARFFRLALQANFSQGRKTSHVIASCLYMVCRTEQTPHMLLDFSDVLQINVFDLGTTFMKLARTLNQRLPIVDPSIFIQRFAHKLELGTKAQAVSSSAVRLVARMRRDWMLMGRRPAGICGAALLIAARMHGFDRTRAEVINVVRVCNYTLRLRLEEFGDTASSTLNREEFGKINLSEEADPPSLKEASRKRKSMQLALEQHNIMERAQRELETEANNPEFQRLNVTVFQNNAPSQMPTSSLPMPRNISGSVVTKRKADDLDASDGCLSDVDDDEINAALRTPEESLKAQMIWENRNFEYIREQEEKERIAAIDAANGIVKQTSKRKKKKGDKKNEKGVIANAKNVLMGKKISKKINYLALERFHASDNVEKKDIELLTASSVSSLTSRSADTPPMKREHLSSQEDTKLKPVDATIVEAKSIPIKPEPSSDYDDNYEDDEDEVPEQAVTGAAAMLGYGGCDDYDDHYDDDNYDD